MFVQWVFMAQNSIWINHVSFSVVLLKNKRKRKKLSWVVETWYLQYDWITITVNNRFQKDLLLIHMGKNASSFSLWFQSCGYNGCVVVKKFSYCFLRFFFFFFRISMNVIFCCFLMFCSSCLPVPGWVASSTRSETRRCQKWLLHSQIVLTVLAPPPPKIHSNHSFSNIKMAFAALAQRENVCFVSLRASYL